MTPWPTSRWGTPADRRERGRRARAQVPPAAAVALPDPAGRVDPLAVLAAQSAGRAPELVPVRHGRMVESPFAFYRGAAAVMAHDLAGAPDSGLRVQLCGDAHLANFGAFASPERRLVFDLNDFDETLPGPFERDVQRLAASVVVCARTRGEKRKFAREAARSTVRAYREAMAQFAASGTLAVWYASLSEQDLRSAISGTGRIDSTGGPDSQQRNRKQRERMGRVLERDLDRARLRDNLSAVATLGERVDGRLQIRHRPPLVVPIRVLATEAGIDADRVTELVGEQFSAYRRSLPDDRRILLDRFEIVDVARKVVGVGSVGLQAFVVLLRGRGDADPLVLQLKEATASVHEPFLGASSYPTPGERIVQGQRAVQSASDVFLGWSHRPEGRSFSWRQLRDMKGSPDLGTVRPAGLLAYARVCGWTLARGHARSGDPVAIAAYLGDDTCFDEAVVEFAGGYADRTERDHSAFVAAIGRGEVPAVRGV